jgi:hypothetical protein
MAEIHYVGCGAPFIPTRDNLLRGPDHFRRCAGCRAAIMQGPPAPASSSEPAIPSPRFCPHCHRWLKSGEHRNGVCPGRSRRRRRSSRDYVAA